MPCCPHCGYEYRGKVKLCPQCGQELVRGPASGRRPGSEDETGRARVPLATVTDPAEAMVLRAALEEAGIAVTIEMHGPLRGIWAPVTDDLGEGHSVLLVPADRLDEAREVMEVLRREPPQWPPGMEPAEDSEASGSA